MVVEVPLWSVVGFALAAVRAGVFVHVAFGFSSLPVPPRVRAALAVALAVPATPLVVGALEPPGGAGVGWLVSEAVTGAVAGALVGLPSAVILAAVGAAGGLVDDSAGFGFARIVDPVTGAPSTPVARLTGTLGVVVLFASGAHLLMVAGWLRTVTAVPSMEAVGRVGLSDGAVMLTGALQLAGGALVVLLVTELLVGLLSRVAPQLNILAVSFSVRLLVAIMVVGAVLVAVPWAVDRLVGHAVGRMLEVGGAAGR